MKTKGDKYIEWIERYIRVPEGKFVGKPLILRPFQRMIIKAIYDATPRPRYVVISMPKKNAKTTLSAMFLLLNICGPEARRNSQLYSTGQSRKQAATIYRLACKMLQFSPDLAAVCVPKDSTKEIVCPELGTEFTALSAEAKNQHGLSPRFLVHDELGMVRGDRWDLYDALETADQAHDDALSIIISTQAPGDGDLLSIIIDDVVRTSADPKARPIVSGDKKKLVFLWAADDKGHEDDKNWAFSEEAMRLANPAYGDFLSEESMKEKAGDANRMRSLENRFRNFQLNQRVEAVDPFIPRGAWLAARAKPDPEVLEKGVLYCGLDLSKRTDLTAMAYIAQGEDRIWNAWVEFWTPAFGLTERAAKDRAPYHDWAEAELIHTTPGATVDYEYPAQRLIDLCEDYEVAVVAFDRWRFDFFAKELARLLDLPTDSPDMVDLVMERIPLRPYGQGFKDMAPALDALEEALLNERLRHGMNPVLTMCSANARADTDKTGARKLDKVKSTGRIDGLQALAMAFGVAAGKEVKTKTGPSVYEERGILVI